jgi:hypothetical protein
MKTKKRYLVILIAMLPFVLTMSPKKMSIYDVYLLALKNKPHDANLLKALAKLKRGENIIFTKYGDGEYNCMLGVHGYNVDHDTYHAWLGESLKQALVSLSKKPNTYIGKWWTADVYEYCNKIAQANNVTIPWVWYHLFMNDDEFTKFNHMYKFVNFMVNTKRKKIVICNSENKRLKDFFRAEVFVEIPAKDWSFDYIAYKQIVESHIVKDAIVLISAGMCSKVLIDDITNERPDVTFIDLGSSFDMLASKKNTRGWHHTYAQELAYYKDFIPERWA